ncbi:MAG: proline dehydrogenase, partial [Gammaproteobacteria bacterium]|nr:proline dehydrogenase [Gammaproteobacteria bacterium]
PGRWPRSVDDVDIVTRLGLDVRVVKGQWLDPQAPDHDARQGYLDVVGRLAGAARKVRVATHDHELASASIAMLKRAGTDCELELLYGLPIGQLAELAVSTDTPVRFYVAFGHAYLPYALGSLKRNPRLILRLLREAMKRNYLASIPDLTSVPPGSEI